MNYIDKEKKIEQINKKDSYIILELGCGTAKKVKNSISLDIVDLPEVDIVCDLNEGFPFIQDNSVDEIHSSHFMEHIDNLGEMLKECYRILKPGGKNIITVPHFSNPYYYSDYTHRFFFGIYSMSYFSKEAYFKRKVPIFYNDIDYRIVKVAINLKSRWLLYRVLYKFMNWLFNNNKTLLEFYETHLCYRFPATEVTYTIEKK